MSADALDLGLASLLRARSAVAYCETHDDQRLQACLAGLAQDAGARLFVWTMTGGVILYPPSGVPQRERLSGAAGPQPTMEEVLRHVWSTPAAPGHTLWLLLDAVVEDTPTTRDVVIRLLKDLHHIFAEDVPVARRLLVLSGVGWSVPASLGGFIQILDLPLPDREEIIGLFDAAELPASVAITPREFADRAVGLSEPAVFDLLADLKGLQQPDRDQALDLVRRTKRAEIRRTQVLEIVDLQGAADLGGWSRFKDWFHLRAPFFAGADRRLAPRGVLLLGFPGCGKSLAARWVAGQLGVPLVSMDIGRIQDRWVGSSEARMRLALRTLEATAPVVLLIDEIEKGLAGAGSDSSGVTTRLVGQLLTWLQDQQQPIFVVATSNSFDFPAELSRAGRFDARFVVGLPTPRERRDILASIGRQLGCALPSDVVDAIVELTAAGEKRLTGAELHQLVKEAGYRARARGSDAPITRADIDAAMEWVTPLVSTPRGEALEKSYEAASHQGFQRVASAGEGT